MLAAEAMEKVITIFSGVVFLCFMVLAMLLVLRMILAGRARPQAVLHEPVVDPNPPEPVVRTAGVTLVALATIAWGVAHLSVIFVWAVTGWWALRTIASASIVLYFATGILISVVGAAMLLACRSYGRRVVSWGMFLLALASFLGGVISLMLTNYQELTPRGQTAALYVAVAFAVHLGIDTAIGAAAQHVGREPAAEVSSEG